MKPKQPRITKYGNYYRIDDEGMYTWTKAVSEARKVGITDEEIDQIAKEFDELPTMDMDGPVRTLGKQMK